MQKNEVVGLALIATGVIGLIAMNTSQTRTIKKLEEKLQSTEFSLDYYKIVVKHQVRKMTFQQFMESTHATIDELEFNHIVKDL